MPHGSLKLRIIVFLFHELINSQRLANHFILAKVAAAPHFFANEFFLVGCEQNFHLWKRRVQRRRCQRFWRSRARGSSFTGFGRNVRCRVCEGSTDQVDETPTGNLLVVHTAIAAGPASSAVGATYL